MFLLTVDVITFYNFITISLPHPLNINDQRQLYRNFEGEFFYVTVSCLKGFINRFIGCKHCLSEKELAVFNVCCSKYGNITFYENIAICFCCLLWILENRNSESS